MDYLNEINLSWIKLFEEINKDFPIYIILDLAKSMGIIYDETKIMDENYIDRLIKKINKLSCKIIKYPLDKQDYRDIARFINYNKISWNIETLNKCLKYIKQFFNKKIVISENFEEGFQTPQNIKKINSFILYAFCIQEKITLKYEINEKELSDHVRKYIKFKVEYVLNFPQIKSYLFDYYCKHNNQENITNKISFLELDEVGRNIRDRCPSIDSMKKMSPQKDSEIIAYFAILYHEDISNVKNFKDKYNEYKSSNRGREYKNITEIDNPDLNIIFNPNFPESFYSISQLKKIAITEGFNDKILNEGKPYKLLQQAYLSQTFFHGKCECVNDSTFIYKEDLNKINNTSLVCFGKRKNRLIYFTYKELYDTFINNKNFQNPIIINKINFFSDLSISKLYYLCTISRYKDEDEENYTTRINLSKLIDSILLENQEKSKEIEILKNIKEVNKAKEILKDILDMSMYMRGWDGYAEYPIEKSYEYDDKIITVKIVDFYELCEKKYDKNILTIILKLPLVRHITDNKYIYSKDIESGITIGDKINLIITGDNNDNIWSCLKVSSNWLISSSYRYLEKLGEKPNFDINNFVGIA
uniref:Uncharacterized protein n=1 Tax=Pithovirus LCPAC104 TaxID=2506589 RepID=A0A481Z4E8_9VIRU|nr:MAG: uncharacterized protein LCPAC104_01440 [Pithovirus LCPAC104]